MTTPIETLLDGVTWKEEESQPISDLPHVTHSGVLDLMGHSMRCYRLSDGRTIFDADDLHAFFGGALHD